MPVYLDKDHRAYKLFVNSLRSEHTRVAYLSGLEDFMEFAKLDTLPDVLATDPKALQDLVIDFVIEERKRLSYASVSTKLAGVMKFCVQADIVTINWKKIHSFMGEHVKTIKDRTYRREELEAIYSKANLRARVILLLLVSTGCRVGAVPDLRVRHLVKWPKEGVYQITFYERSKEEYFSFCTPECVTVIDEYMSYRRVAGESITDDSYLIRDEFDINNVEVVKHPSKTTTGSIRSQFLRFTFKSGVREKRNGDTFTHKRREVMLLHATRKYCNTQLLKAGCNVVIKEMLIGHSVNLDDAYYRPTAEELLKEYLRAADLLTISDDARLNRQVSVLKEEVSTLRTLELEVGRKDRETRDLKNEVAELKALVIGLKAHIDDDLNPIVSSKVEESFDDSEVVEQDIESEKLGGRSQAKFSNHPYNPPEESKKYRDLKAKISVTDFGGSPKTLLPKSVPYAEETRI